MAPPEGSLVPRAPAVAPSGQAVPDLSKANFEIYAWPWPGPKDLLALSPAFRAWKEQEAAAAAAADDDDGLDEWEEFPAHESYYPRGGGLALAIARNLAVRAKRAFRSGITWDQYKQTELAVDILSVVNKEYNAAKWQKLCENTLDNDLRLLIFKHIEERLCNEIWLKAWEPVDRMAPAAAPNTESTIKQPEDEISFKPMSNESEELLRGRLAAAREESAFQHPVYPADRRYHVPGQDQAGS